MVQINFAQKQVNAKIVYYGPGMSGKTTNLEIIHQRAPKANRGDLTSISTDGDRTLFFDFMPLDLGTVAGMRTCFQIYTVPGQVYYNSTRKLVLQGVDGVIFIADSSASMLEENLESMRNLEANLAEYGRSLAELPLVIQYNKRDLPDAMPVEELDAQLNPWHAPAFEGIAHTGQGVFPTLKALAARVIENIHNQQRSTAGSASIASAPAALPSEAPVQQPALQRAALSRSPAGTGAAAESAAVAGGSRPAAPAVAARARSAPNPAPSRPAAAAPARPAGELRIASPSAHRAASGRPSVPPSRPGAAPSQERGSTHALRRPQDNASMKLTPRRGSAPAAAPNKAQAASAAEPEGNPAQRRAPRPTPTPVAGGRRGIVTAVVVVVSIAVGVALGRFVLGIF